MEAYGIKTGDVFSLKTEGGDLYVVSGFVTHSFDFTTQKPMAMPDPDIVFRAVNVVNSWPPVPMEVIIIKLSDFKRLMKVIPLSERL